VTRHEQQAPPALPELLPPLDDQQGPAEPISAAAQGAMIQAALTASPPPPILWTRRLFLLGSAAVVAAGAAGYGLTRRARTASEIPQPAAPQPAALQPSSLQPAAAQPADTPQAVMAAPSHPAAEPAIVPSEPAAPEERAAPVRKRASGPREVADLLHQANERRRQQRFSEALRLYQQILDGHPHSDEAYVARVAAGSLLLDRMHSPQAALKQFKRALRERPSGSLSEEARLGLCEVQRALRDGPAERAALQEFLTNHGDSPARARVAARLTKLEGR
jgi:tetratricopeptide (TPR) repeat protein